MNLQHICPKVYNSENCELGHMEHLLLMMMLMQTMLHCNLWDLFLSKTFWHTPTIQTPCYSYKPNFDLGRRARNILHQTGSTELKHETTKCILKSKYLAHWHWGMMETLFLHLKLKTSQWWVLHMQLLLWRHLSWLHGGCHLKHSHDSAWKNIQNEYE